MSTLSILLADDHRMMRDGLRMLINAQPDMEVIGEADNGRKAVSLPLRLRPVMEVSMPELNGLKATEELKSRCPDIKIPTLTRHTDDGYLQLLLEAAASGYVLKQSASDELVHAIRAVGVGWPRFFPTIFGVRIREGC